MTIVNSETLALCLTISSGITVRLINHRIEPICLLLTCYNCYGNPPLYPGPLYPGTFYHGHALPPTPRPRHFHHCFVISIYLQSKLIHGLCFVHHCPSFSFCKLTKVAIPELKLECTTRYLGQLYSYTRFNQLKHRVCITQLKRY